MGVKFTSGEVAYRGTELAERECGMSPGEAFEVFLSLLNEAIEREVMQGKRGSRRSPYILHELKDIRNELLTIFWSDCGPVPRTGCPTEPVEKSARLRMIAS
jgi:hypothetical protein